MDDYKENLLKYTIAAKTIVYNAERGYALLKMMTSVGGAINAVHAVLAGINQKSKVPPEIAPLLAVNILMLLVDMARKVGKAPDKKVLDFAVKKLMDEVTKNHPLPPQPAPQEAQQQPTPPAQPQPGMIQGA